MKWGLRTADGRKSIDRKVRKLLQYVNKQMMATGVWSGGTEDDMIEWAKTTIETGIKNIAADCVAVREE